MNENKKPASLATPALTLLIVWCIALTTAVTVLTVRVNAVDAAHAGTRELVIKQVDLTSEIVDALKLLHELVRRPRAGGAA